MYGNNDTPPHASHYTPKFQPGARLPHAWIRFRDQVSAPSIEPLDVSYVTELSRDEVDACRFSMLDLCAVDAFTLIVGEYETWASRYHALLAAFSGWNLKLSLYAADQHFEIIRSDHRALFNDGVQLSSGGGLLVRPDQHILTKLSSDTCFLDMQLALEQHLGI